MLNWKSATDNISNWMDTQIARIPEQGFMAVAIVCSVCVGAIVVYLLVDLAVDLIR